MNIITITGHLAQDPELRHTPSGKAVAHLRVAVNTNRKNSNGEPYPADFFSFDAWNGAENHAKHLTKGQHVEIVGRLSDEKWETSDGDKRSRVALIAERVQYGRKPNGQQPTNQPADTDEEPF